MKKTNNKGFSLVELIIVIAIMAILAGAIAPALIKYIDKSRKSNDVSAAKTIKTAIETALGTEEVYETLTNNGGGTTVITFVSNATVPATKEDGDSAAASLKTDYMTISGCSNPNGNNKTMSDADICLSIASNIGEKIPKTKYKKMIDNTGTKVKSGGFTPDTFYAFITSGGTVAVAVGESGKTVSYTAASGSSAAKFTGCAPLAPEVCKGYQ